MRDDDPVGYAAAAADLAAAASGLVEHLEKVSRAPVEVIREGAGEQRRTASVGHGLLQLLAADFKQNNLSNAELPLGAALPPFDFALALGNFTARDEEVFTSHALETPLAADETDEADGDGGREEIRRRTRPHLPLAGGDARRGRGDRQRGGGEPRAELA